MSNEIYTKWHIVQQSHAHTHNLCIVSAMIEIERDEDINISRVVILVEVN